MINDVLRNITFFFLLIFLKKNRQNNVHTKSKKKHIDACAGCVSALYTPFIS